MSFDTLVSAVVTVAQRGEKSATLTTVNVGKAAHKAVVCHLEAITDKAARKDRRAEALRIIGEKLAAAGVTSNVNRSIQVYHVANTYNLAEARELPLRTVRAFGGTLQRIAKNEEWKLRPKAADSCRALWARVVSGEVQPADVAAAVRTVLGKKPPAARSKPSPVEKVKKLLPQLSEENRRALYTALAREFADQPAGSNNSADVQVSVPMGDPPGKVSDVVEPTSIRERFARRRAG